MPKASAAEYDRWAEFYDILHQGLPGEAEFYVGQAVRAGGEVLEIGCGTGRIAIPMAMCGVRVTGLDNSTAMLDRCRVKRRAVGPVPGKLTLVKSDMRDFNLRRTFDLVVAPYRTLMHLLTPEDWRRCLECVHRHLSDSGRFMFNCWHPQPSLLAPLSGPQSGLLRFVGAHACPGRPQTLRHFCATSCDESRQILSEEHVIHTVSVGGKVSRTDVLSLERAWFTARETQSLVREAGFEVEALFGDFDCNPLTPASTEMLWILRK
jgi:SAM-dependent methyltransferase